MLVAATSSYHWLRLGRRDDCLLFLLPADWGNFNLAFFVVLTVVAVSVFNLLMVFGIWNKVGIPDYPNRFK